jgi:hypothetical protein
MPFYISKLFKHFKSSIDQTTLLFDLNLNYFNQGQPAFDLVFSSRDSLFDLIQVKSDRVKHQARLLKVPTLIECV